MKTFIHLDKNNIAICTIQTNGDVAEMQGMKQLVVDSQEPVAGKVYEEASKTFYEPKIIKEKVIKDGKEADVERVIADKKRPVSLKSQLMTRGEFKAKKTKVQE